MNILLTTTMAIGVVFMLGANQPVEAKALQSVGVPTYQQGQIEPVRYYRYYHEGPYYYSDPYYYPYYDRGSGFRFQFGL